MTLDRRSFIKVLGSASGLALAGCAAQGPVGLSRERRLDRLQDRCRFGHASESVLAAGKLATTAGQHLDAAFGQQRQIVPRGLVLVHRPVHGGRHDHRSTEGEVCRRQ